MYVSINLKGHMRIVAPALFLFSMLFVATDTIAQEPEITVRGQVTDSQGEPLIAVSVILKGTQRNATTNIDGNYEMTVPSNGTLEFSTIGMVTQSIAVNGRSTINVVMQDDNLFLEELVVVGYGTQRKENLTGAVSTVNVERALENKPFTDPAKGLQGAIPGLTITFSNGAINKEPVLNIRGLGSLNAENGGSPLILVDNVVVNDISVVNADDIASVSVLKDASSTAIYGARAAFGVILIKTKSGKTGSKFTVSYSNNFSWGAPTVLPKFAKDPVAEIAAM